MTTVLRIKYKQLLLLAAIVIVALLVAYMALPALLNKVAENNYAKGERALAAAYYERINNYFPHSSYAATSLERLAEYKTSGNSILIMPNSFGSTQSHPYIVNQEALTYYRELVERFPNSFAGQRAATRLVVHEAYALIKQTDFDALIPLITAYYENQRHPEVHRLIAIIEYLGNSSQQPLAQKTALDLVELMLELQKNSVHLDLYELAGSLYSLDNPELAVHYYELALAEYQISQQHHAQLQVDNEQKSERVGYNDYYSEKTTALQKIISDLRTYINSEQLPENSSLRQKELAGTVTGKVSLRGQAFADVQVVLQPFMDDGFYSSIMPDSIWTFTESNGTFKFDNVPVGRWSLGFVLDLEHTGNVVLAGGRFPKSHLDVVADETVAWEFNLVEPIATTSVTEINNATELLFEWEEHSEAAYYTLHLGIRRDGGTIYGQVATDNFTDTHATLTLQEIKSWQTGLSYDDNSPDPQSFFGYTLPGGTLFWGINAHNEDGHILSSSIGYLDNKATDFTIFSLEKTAADQLLLNKNFQAAHEAYQEQLTQDPYNTHALRMLAAFYSVSDAPVFQDFAYSNYARAIVYYRQLYEITGEVGYLSATIHLIRQLEEPDRDLLFIETLQQISEHRLLTDWELQQLTDLTQ